MPRVNKTFRGCLGCVLIAIFATFLAASASGQTSAASVVRIPVSRDFGKLTPFSSDIAYPFMTLVYDTLMWRDPAGVPQPWLADSVETSPDGLDLKIRLANGATWHDGQPVTSQDVAFSYRYFVERAHPRFAPQLRPIGGLATPDSKTLEIRLRFTSPGFLDQPLADVPILPRHLWEKLPAEGDLPDGLALGSGPYRLVEHRTDESYRFESNETYFRGPPSVKTIEVPIIKTTEGRIRAFERREVDIVSVHFPKTLVNRVQMLGVNVDEGPSFAGTALIFNLASPPFDQADVRRAVARSLDVPRIRRVIGRAVDADHGYLHPRSAWATALIVSDFNERATRADLTRLDVGPVQIITPGDDLVQLEAARQVEFALKRAGVAAMSQRVSEGEYLRAVGAGGSPPTFTLAIGRIPALASFDPSFLSAVFVSDPLVAPLNYSGYKSDAFDGIARRIVSEPDVNARRAAVEEGLRLLSADVPVVPLFFSNSVFASRTAIFKDWVIARGTAAIDKRSFTDPPIALARPSSTGVDVEPRAKKPGSTSLLRVGAISLIALAGILAAVDLARRLRRRRD